MNKELIEQAVVEVANDMLCYMNHLELLKDGVRYTKDELVEFTTLVLRRIDAERGKSCVCGDPATLGIVHRTEGPCFLAPTIPEGMAQDACRYRAKRQRDFIQRGASDEEIYNLAYDRSCDFLIAAAQGERK